MKRTAKTERWLEGEAQIDKQKKKRSPTGNIERGSLTSLVRLLGRSVGRSVDRSTVESSGGCLCERQSCSRRSDGSE